MKQHRSGTKPTRTYSKTGVQGTVRGLVNPSRRDHRASFEHILPKAMDKLVADGLFERIENDEYGHSQYKITIKGLKLLKEKGL